MRVFTVGHGARAGDALVQTVAAAGVATVVDVRRFPSSRRHPHFNGAPLAQALAGAGIAYQHEVALGGRRRDEPGEERFACLRVSAFRSYVARMAHPDWQAALARSLEVPAPCFLCAETLWWRCHRRFISELLVARGHEVVHLLGPHETQPHRLLEEADVRAGRLFLCGELVA